MRYRKFDEMSDCEKLELTLHYLRGGDIEVSYYGGTWQTTKPTFKGDWYYRIVEPADIRTKLTYPEDYPDYESVYAEAMKEIDRLDVEVKNLKKESANDL